MNGLLRCLSPLVALAILFSPAANAADALHGKSLYLNGPANGGTSCAACHGPTPADNVNGILAAANKPNVISAALASNLGGMGALFNGRLSATDIADLAAFIGNPNVTAAPAASMTPDSLGFAATTVGQSANALAATLSNTGNAALNIATLSLTGNAAPDYSISGGSCVGGVSLAPGANCTVQITFKPSAAGVRNATLVLTHNATGGSITIALTGTGNAVPQASISLSGNVIDFGALVSGVASPARSVTVSNTGQAPLIFNGITFTGANASVFALGGTCSTATPVAAGSSCTVTVSANASASGAFNASLTLASNAANAPVLVALTGNVSGPKPSIAATPSAISFGAHAIDSAISTQDVTLANTGNVVLDLKSISVTGATSVSIAAKSCGLTLAVGANCTVTLAYAPVAEGAAASTLAVTSNALPLQVNISGSGTKAPVGKANLSDAGPLTFADTLVGKTSDNRTVTLSNSGTAALKVTSVVLNGQQASDFVLGGSCTANTSISAGGACTLEISFRPTAAGQRSATSVLMVDTGNQLTIPLGGTGIAVPAPHLSLSSQTIDFGDADVNGASITHRVSVTNMGANVATLTAANFTGPFSLQADSSGCPAFPFTLAPGANCEMTVRFIPTALGSANGSMALSTDSGTALTLALSGSATRKGSPMPQNEGGGGCSSIKGGNDPVLALLVVLSVGVLLWRRVMRKPEAQS